MRSFPCPFRRRGRGVADRGARGGHLSRWPLGSLGWCLGTILLCVGALGVYKYADFSIRASVGLFDPNLAAQGVLWLKQLLPAAPPLAISFFTFEFVHYLYDVRKGACGLRIPWTSPCSRSFFHRSSRVRSSVAGISSHPCTGCRRSYDRRCRGGVGEDRHWLRQEGRHLRQSGAGYQLLRPDFHPPVARDSLAPLCGHRLPHLTRLQRYSDIAIGLARMFGITLPENFRWPYLAKNLQEFWQRWHISAEYVIRDYIYIPLGGSRFGVTRKIINGFIVFALCGLWHGAAWNFILWGCLPRRRSSRLWQLPLVVGDALEAARACSLTAALPLSWVLTTGYVWLGWLLFFYPLPQAWKMAAALFPDEIFVSDCGHRGSHRRIRHLLCARPLVRAKEYLQGFRAPAIRSSSRRLPTIRRRHNWWPWRARSVRRRRTRRSSFSAATRCSTAPVKSGTNFGRGRFKSNWEITIRWSISPHRAAGAVDNGGVIFECLARDYPRALFVTNIEPGILSRREPKRLRLSFLGCLLQRLVIERRPACRAYRTGKSDLGRYGVQAEPPVEQCLLLQ